MYIIFLCIFVPVSHRSHGKEPGQVLVLGQGDVGQLGLGENVIERKKPALLSLPEKMVQVIAGGMHTVCLSDTGNVSKSLSYFVLGQNCMTNSQPISHLRESKLCCFCVFFVLGLHFWLQR